MKHASLLSAALLALVPSAAARASASLEIVVKGGEHGGTHTLPISNTTCLHTEARKQFSTTFSDRDATDASRISGAGIDIFDPDAGDPKKGQINVRFGDPESARPAAFEISVPGDGAGKLTFTRNGKGAEMTFEGKSKEGTKVRITARCSEFEEF